MGERDSFGERPMISLPELVGSEDRVDVEKNGDDGVESGSESVQERKEQARSKLKTLAAIVERDEFGEGVEAAIRSIINAGVIITDTMPGPGEAPSLGVDILKGVARVKYRHQRKVAEMRGEDPDKVRLSKVDLTPDVPMSVVIIAETIDLASGGFIPSHAVAGGYQIVIKDMPKMYRALRAAKDEIAEHIRLAEEDSKLAEAVNRFIEEE